MVVATVLVGQWTDVVQTKILQKLFCTANHSANRMNPIDLVIPDFSSYWSDAEIEKWLKVCQFRLSGMYQSLDWYTDSRSLSQFEPNEMWLSFQSITDHFRCYNA